MPPSFCSRCCLVRRSTHNPRYNTLFVALVSRPRCLNRIPNHCILFCKDLYSSARRICLTDAGDIDTNRVSQPFNEKYPSQCAMMLVMARSSYVGNIWWCDDQAESSTQTVSVSQRRHVSACANHKPSWENKSPVKVGGTRPRRVALRSQSSPMLSSSSKSSWYLISWRSESGTGRPSSGKSLAAL